MITIDTVSDHPTALLGNADLLLAAILGTLTATADPSAPLAQKLRGLERLKQLGAQVWTVPGDVADVPFVADLVARGKAKRAAGAKAAVASGKKR